MGEAEEALACSVIPFIVCVKDKRKRFAFYLERLLFFTDKKKGIHS